MSREFQSPDTTEKATVEVALNKCRALAAQIKSELRNKERPVDKASLAELFAALERAADILRHKKVTASSQVPPVKRQIIADDLPPLSRAWGFRLFEERGGKLKIQQKFRRRRDTYEGLLCRQPGIDFIYQCATVLKGGLSLDFLGHDGPSAKAYMGIRLTWGLQKDNQEICTNYFCGVRGWRTQQHAEQIKPGNVLASAEIRVRPFCMGTLHSME